MPELPEVETIVRQLQPVVTGKSVKAVSILWHRTVTGDHDKFKAALIGSRLIRIARRGKYICLFTGTGDCITIHLRMTGRLKFQLDEKEKNYTRAVFDFQDGSSLYFIDVRKFGRIMLWPKGSPLLPQLGPEPLEETPVFAALSGLTSIRAIKTVLLDQTVLAGVGNIYADEALYLAKIHPATPAAKVSKRKLKTLSRFIPEVLQSAIHHDGTTIIDYRSTGGSEGRNQFYLNVYGRIGQPCGSCGTEIQRIRLNNRSSHFCPKCQRRQR